MRRDQLANAFDSITKVLNQSGAIKLFLSGGSKTEGTPDRISSVLSVMKCITQLSEAEFGKPERIILGQFGIEDLLEPEYWTKLILGDSAGRGGGARRSAIFAAEFFPVIAKLIRQTPPIQDNNGREVLKVYLLQEKGYSKPERLQNLFEAINSFSSACGTILKHTEGLSIVAIDSGSDISVDFLGNAEVVRCIKDIIFGLWDRVVFFREKKIENRLELIAKSLPIIEQISKMEQNSDIGPEQAEILRRQIVDGSMKFVSSGATIPELETISYSPRQILAPESKMIAAPGVIESQPTEAKSPSAKEDIQCEEVNVRSVNNLFREDVGIDEKTKNKILELLGMKQPEQENSGD